MDHAAIYARIYEIAMREAELDESAAKDAAFHLTDWLADLQAFHRFCTDPYAVPDDQVDDLLRGFLIHVPNHVAAASKLYTGIPVTDIFGIGATSEDEKN